MRVAAWLVLASVHAYCAAGTVTEGPWLLNGEPVPEQGLRITTLGSGTPDVRKDQASSGFLLELGNGDKFIWDLGTGSYQNLLATAVPAAQLTKVGEAQYPTIIASLQSTQGGGCWWKVILLEHSYYICMQLVKFSPESGSLQASVTM